MKIVSDGTPLGTKLLTDDGKEIQGITELNVRATHEGIHADAQIFIQKLDAVGLPTRIMGPNGKYISKIMYADGTVDDYSKP